MKLAGTTAIVTGASRGIGRAIALRLASAGAELALWARDKAALDGVAAEIAAANGKAIAYLNAHAEIYRQEYRGDDVVYRCVLSKHLVHHVRATGAEVTVLK